MTKRERIEALEKQMAELRQEVDRLRADLAARPYWPYYTWPTPVTPLEPYKITWTLTDGGISTAPPIVIPVKGG